jgi:hypothetical protein
MQVTPSASRFVLIWALALTTPALPACSLFAGAERVLYEQQGIRIGVEPDPSINRANGSAVNAHPSDLSAADWERILSAIQVSGWSGTLAGILGDPRPIPLLTTDELPVVSQQVATAFRQVSPVERVFFSLPKSGPAYSEDRTAGSLFIRGRYVHLVLHDHSAFIQADTGGGEPKDIRDTKGMKLWIASPARAATVPDVEEPAWAPFESTHISVTLKEVLAQRALPTAARQNRDDRGTSPPAAVATGPSQDRSAASPQDLQLQIKELTSSNLELRGRLEEQMKKMEQLNTQMEQLRLELDKTKSKKQPARKPVAP